ncbi:SHOCT domain-containing protein [Succinimonas amylolytica]|uniref:SHOCT domain-containing protein n=1 Tax=Succinimonas amylolytica TaxID=83769 RepID=UPI00036F943B|nr:SHOCT domain-containing protein [Succinimonas amylolytica]
MQVTEVISVTTPSTTLSQITQDQLQQEFNFLRAEQITRTMLNQGLITADEYRRIMVENTITFPTFISSIL